jgi:DNA-directed RNA polymerase subunit alpha
MAVTYGKFEMPTKIVVNEDKSRPNFVQFVLEPFERGFGHTLGNSMRRILLTALEAPAIVSVRIEGVPHEYMAVEGIIEDMTNIVLNLKGALLRKLPTDNNDSARDIRAITSVLEVTQDDLDANGGYYEVKLGDIVKPGNFEVVNPDHKLFTATIPMKKQVDLKVKMGRGYVPTERLNIPEKNQDEILIDASYSPVVLVNYSILNTRVGEATNFDKLVLEVETDGRITPAEAVTFASQIGLKHFDVFNQVKTHAIVFEDRERSSSSEDDELLDKLALKIDEIELSVRSTNCLSGADIETIAELILIPERKMLEFKNFGKKSLNEIKAKLDEMGLSLGTDLSKYGITLDNVKEKMREYHELHRDKGEVFTDEELS